MNKLGARKRIHPKVRAGGVTGALSVVLLGVATRLHVELTAAEAGALATLAITASAYHKAA